MYSELQLCALKWTIHIIYINFIKDLNYTLIFTCTPYSSVKIDVLFATETGGICISPRPSSPGAEIKPAMPMRPFFGIEPVIMDEQVRILFYCLYCLIYFFLTIHSLESKDKDIGFYIYKIPDRKVRFLCTRKLMSLAHVSSRV